MKERLRDRKTSPSSSVFGRRRASRRRPYYWFSDVQLLSSTGLANGGDDSWRFDTRKSGGGREGRRLVAQSPPRAAVRRDGGLLTVLELVSLSKSSLSESCGSGSSKVRSVVRRYSAVSPHRISGSKVVDRKIAHISRHSATILARMSAMMSGSVSASWKAGYQTQGHHPR